MSSRFRCVLRKLLQVKYKYQPIPSTLYRQYNRCHVTVPCTLGISILTLIGLEKKLSAEDELIQTIKHCVLFIQREEYDKAEQLLHVALRNAQQINHQLAITYVYDVMANLALEREQYSKAKQLFIAVTQRIMADGATDDDLRVLHISAKLARISHMQKELTTAQLGYDWCLQKLSSKPASDDVNKLMALTEDWYGRLFLDCDQCEQALNLLKSAYERMKGISDFDPEHLMVQLNDIGTVCDRIGRVDESISYFQQAINLGKEIPDMNDLGSFYVNLGRAYMKKNLLDQARKSCGHGWKLSITVKNKDAKAEAEKCLKEIKNLS
ncbi:tetratricopeptide repeat protein 19 homolog, mitochondrial [Epargyreus clarus]|uniref:tetratricopeptide repeat protein 19 homolog, mitochondrial n=1 Tax=Epargyreus clarus TaxID=520877 RepID=UPI003C30DAC9